eukprot:1194692-Prorocentrum_minimum.AAC.3
MLTALPKKYTSTGSVTTKRWCARLMQGLGQQYYYNEKEVPYKSVMLADVTRAQGSMAKGKQQHRRP